MFYCFINPEWCRTVFPLFHSPGIHSALCLYPTSDYSKHQEAVAENWHGQTTNMELAELQVYNKIDQ